ncbi:TPA: hypothetical protein EYN09_05640 [Candidatus Poribacteria bacterium]|nr:hypothetical protein [Flavobacteriales bacterium]HIO06395.1 hypothetical protein [Candidatus Poribacteria bacterium]
MKKYQVIYVDPPWDYKGQKQHNGEGGIDTGGAISHYSTIKLKDLKRLNVTSICDDDCLLFMWTTNPHLDQAVDLMRSWGFKWATVGFVWDKVRVNPGFYTMSQCELCLLGKRGRIPQPRGIRNARQYVYSKRTKHSQKPEEVRQRIEDMFPVQNKIELFARRRVDGWDCWGDEVISDVSLDIV